MPTHTIGKGNRMIGIAQDRQIVSLLGRLATEENRSVAGFVWVNFLKGLEATNAAAAEQIKAAREEKLRAIRGVVCLAVGLLAIGCAISSGAELRRPRRGRRVEVEHNIEA